MAPGDLTSKEFANHIHRELLQYEQHHTPNSGGAGVAVSRNIAAAAAAGIERQRHQLPQNAAHKHANIALTSPTSSEYNRYRYTDDDDYFNRHELDALHTGGKRLTFDSSKLRGSTIKSLKSHIALLAQNGIDIDNLQSSLTGRNINKLLDSMRLKNGAKLSPGYKQQIGNSIMKLVHNQATYDPKVYRAQRQRPTAHTAPPELFSHLEQLIEFSARQIRESLYNPIIDNLSAYDTSMAALLSAGTAMRLHELQQLRMSDVSNILKGVPIYIRSKNSRYDQRTVIRHAFLNTTLLALMFNRKKAVTAARHNDNNRSIKYKATRLDNDNALLTSESQLVRTIKEHASMIGVRIESLGFNKFRKLTISMLVENGASEIARFANMHSKLRTTVHNYYISTTRQLGRVQSELSGDGGVATSATTNTTFTTTDTTDNSSFVKRPETQTSQTEQSHAAPSSLLDELNTAYSRRDPTSTTSNDFNVGGDDDDNITDDDSDGNTINDIHYLTPPVTPAWQKP